MQNSRLLNMFDSLVAINRGKQRKGRRKGVNCAGFVFVIPCRVLALFSLNMAVFPSLSRRRFTFILNPVF